MKKCTVDEKIMQGFLLVGLTIVVVILFVIVFILTPYEAIRGK